MDVRTHHQRSEGESSDKGQFVISKAVALSRMQPSNAPPCITNGHRCASTTDRCPRCGKDIPAPMLLAHAKAEEYLIELIQRDHPEWVQPDGTCPRCKFYYRVLAKRTGV